MNDGFPRRSTPPDVIRHVCDHLEGFLPRVKQDVRPALIASLTSLRLVADELDGQSLNDEAPGS